MIYKVGLGADETNEVSLNKSGLVFSSVSPREKIIQSAKSVIGQAYKRGASVSNDAPRCFDCSSLVAWCAVEAGLSIPRISVDQYVFSKRIPKEDLMPGDLVFANTKKIIHTDGYYFSKVLGKEVKEEAIRTETLEYMPGTKVPEGIDHVGIYIGDGKIIHASIHVGTVSEEKLSESAQFKNIIGYGRIIDDDNKRFVIKIPENRTDLRNRENLIKEINRHS